MKKINWPVYIGNFIIIFIASLLKFSVDKNPFSNTYNQFIFSPVAFIIATISAFFVIGIFHGLNIFTGNKIQSLNKNQTKIIQITKCIQFFAISLSLIMIAGRDSFFSNIPINIYLTEFLLIVVSIFLIPGIVAIRHQIFTNGILQFGATIQLGQQARTKGIILIIGAIIITIALIGLLILGDTYDFI